MSNFSLAGQPVTHPSWCDPAYCTAPATYPAASERGNHTEHRSAPLGKDGMVFEGDQVYLTQSTSVPWECETFLKIEAVDITGGRSRHLSIPLGTTSPLMWAILAHADDEYRRYPTLMQAEGVKRGGPWRPLTTADALPEPRTAAPLADVTSASGETARTEIVPADSDDDLDTVPAPDLEAIQARLCATLVKGAALKGVERQLTGNGAPLTLAEYRSALTWWEEKAEERRIAGDELGLTYRTEGAEVIRQTIQRLEREEAARRTKGVAQLRAAIRPLAELPISEESRLAIEEDVTAFPKAPLQPWMACADCSDSEACYNGEMNCP